MTYAKSILCPLLLLVVSVSAHAENKSCLTCQFPMSPQSAKPGEVDPCSDLFGAACLASDGKSKYHEFSKGLDENLKKDISDIRDKAAQEMGYKDMNEAIRKELQKAGLELKENPDGEAYKSLKMESNVISFGGDGAKKLYVAAEKCDKEIQEIRDVQYYSLTDVSQLKDLAKKYEDAREKYRVMSVKHYAKDIPNFISSLGGKCNQTKSGTPNVKPEENDELIKACAQFRKIKRQAVELFRAEGTPEYEKKAEAFVKSNLLPEVKYSYSTSSSAPSTGAEKDEVTKLREKIGSLSSESYSICNGYFSVVETAGRKVVSDLLEKTSKSKLMVEGVVDSFYSADRKKAAMEMYESARGDIRDLVKGFVKDPRKRGEILDGYDSLKLFWMEKPSEDAYRVKDGVKVLDTEKLSMMDMTGQVFSDPSLGFFTQVNAFYTPQMSVGKMKVEEQVNMMPAFIKMMDKNPYAFLSVVAHEAGHKIGPSISKLNGYDLDPEYRELLACYKSNDSIKMEDQQQDETIADYISSEVLARQIQKLPADKRKQALMSSMEDFCIFDDYGEQGHSVSCKGAHPENSLRVGGVYGANPSIRKIMGCEADSSNFKTCGMKVSILDLPDSGGTSGSKGKRTGHDGKSTKGVK